MAKLIQAYSKYCPKIDLMEPADPKRFMKLITKRTTLSDGVVKNVQESEVDTLIDLLQEGRSVHTGIAIFRPTIDAQGNLSVSVRVDKRILAALNVPGAFTGKVTNSANIGMSAEEIAALWNEENPENPIELSTAPVG
jgi:HU domain-containing protein